MKHSDLIQLAADYLSAELEPGKVATYVYKDDGTGHRYRVSRTAVLMLGRMLSEAVTSSDANDTYSVWCSLTFSEDLGR